MDKIFVVASPRFDFIACSKGAKAFVSSIKSPRLLSSSSPTGFSREIIVSVVSIVFGPVAQLVRAVHS